MNNLQTPQTFNVPEGSTILLNCNGNTLRIPLKGNQFSLQVLPPANYAPSSGINLEKSDMECETRDLVSSADSFGYDNQVPPPTYSSQVQSVADAKKQFKYEAKMNKAEAKANKKRLELEAKNQKYQTKQGTLEGTRSLTIPNDPVDVAAFNVFQEQLNRLQEDGFYDLDKNLKVLQKFGGDYEQAKAKLDKKRYKKSGQKKMDKLDAKLEKKKQKMDKKYEAK